VNEQLIPERDRRIDVSKLLMGLFLVALGVTFLFERLYWWDAHELFRLWPLWLIGFGLLRVAYPRRRHGRLSGFWPILIGGIFLLDTLDLMHLHNSWPLFIVGGGLLMMLRAAGVGGCARNGEPARGRSES
jgi:hypothetical protein